MPALYVLLTVRKDTIMLNPRTMCVALIAALCSTLPAVAQEFKIGVANTGKVFTEMQETKDLQSSLQNQTRTLKAENEKRRAEIDNLAADLQTFKPDSPQGMQAGADLLKKRIEYQNWAQFTEA